MVSDDNNPQAGQNRPLPKKDQDTFRQLVRQYETKQYKKGIKSADSILKKFPRHGETLCMKGLILNCMSKGTEQRDEAIGMVKLGLMNDMRSHVCWHVYGLIYRSERNYSEAIKAYKQALRIDPQNIQILRDLSLLQVQIRDLIGFVQTRHSILELKPDQKTNWLTFALSKHLIGEIDDAINIIDIYLDTLTQGSGGSTNIPEFQCNYESSELALYKNMLICEKMEAQHQQASKTATSTTTDSERCYKEPYDHLLSIQHLITDKCSFFQSKALYELRLGQFEDAKKTYLHLFDQLGATEDYKIHSGFMCSLLKLDTEKISYFYSLLEKPSVRKLVTGARTLATIIPLSKQQKDVLYHEYSVSLANLYPKSHTIRRIPLTLLDHESKEWQYRFKTYVKKQIKSGVPSLGSDIASLFLMEVNGKACGTNGDKDLHSYYVIASDPCDIIIHPIYQYCSRLVDEYIASLEQSSKFPGDDDGDSTIEPPSTLLWAWYLRAVLYDLTGQYSKGLEYTTKCLDQTPTAVDVYELQGKLYEHGGDIHKAVSSTNEGRMLDKQDRYINNQTVKYLLRAGKEKEALETIALFTRHESEPEQNIYDMQCYWYEMELGKCLEKKGEMGKALKKFMAIEKHFEDFNEDQFDFHPYCIRKVTLRSYVQLLRWENSLWGHDVYTNAAECIIKIYLSLFDNPPKIEVDNIEPDYSKMTAAERKKAKAQARKKKKKAEEEAKKEAQAKENQGGKDGSSSKPKDDDVNGKKLLEMDPLSQARKYTATLVKNAPTHLSTWLCQYDVAIRSKKYFIALRALKKALSLTSPDKNGYVFTRMVEFHRLKVEPYANDDVQKVFEMQKLAVFGGKNLNEFIEDISKAILDSKTDLKVRVAVAKSLTDTNMEWKKLACDTITGRGLDVHGITLDNCSASIDYLNSLGDDDTDVNKARDNWIKLTKERFFLTNLF